MKYLKLFEKANVDEPQIGDYVICSATEDVDDELKNFLLTAIGQIRNKNHRGIYDYSVYFENIPQHVIDNWDNPIDFQKSEIENWSKNKEDLEYIIAAKKYNL
jgi:hypothetical protein